MWLRPHRGERVPTLDGVRVRGEADSKLYSLFFLDEKETPERVNGFGLRLSGCLHTSRIKLRALMTLTRVLSQKGVFFVFFLNQKQWLEVRGQLAVSG